MRDLAVHIHKLLLAGRSHGGIHAREELHGSELGSEALSIHQALNHAHNGRLEVTYADRLQYSLHAFGRLHHTWVMSIRFMTKIWKETRLSLRNSN